MATNGEKTEGVDDGSNTNQSWDKLKKFPPEEEASMVTASSAHKAEANALFLSEKYDAALTKYDDAVTVCPPYLDYELAVLRSNMAACHLNLKEWKEAITDATISLKRLDDLEQKEKAKADQAQKEKDEENDVEAEIVSPLAAKAGPPLPEAVDKEAEAAREKLANNIARIRAKALLRRGRGRVELGGWSNLEGALEDYKKLLSMPKYLGPADKKNAESQIKALPARIKTAKEEETAEMWSKLKGLGDGLLKPFGLSTDNFKMVQDEKTGGYSMNFEGGAGGSR